MKVQLEDLLKAFELNNPYLKFYVHKTDGKLTLVTEIPGNAPADNDVTAHPDDYLKLPTQADLNLPEMIKGFVPMMKDAKQRETFAASIEAGKSLAQLEHALRAMGLVQYWYTFQQMEFEKIAKTWCDDHGISYEA